MTILGSNPRARVDIRHPEAFASCDRCGFLYNLKDLRFQMAWRGNDLISTNWLVCTPCYDVPFQLNRPVYLPPDPAPVPNARPPQWASEEGPEPANIPVQQLITED